MAMGRRGKLPSPFALHPPTTRRYTVVNPHEPKLPKALDRLARHAENVSRQAMRAREYQIASHVTSFAQSVDYYKRALEREAGLPPDLHVCTTEQMEQPELPF